MSAAFGRLPPHNLQYQLEDGRLTGGRGRDAPAFFSMQCRPRITALSSKAKFLIVMISMNMQDKPVEQEAGPRADEGMLFNRMLKSRTVLVSGEINKQLAERVIRSLILLEEESKDPIKVYIDSPGGDADAGYAIFDMMRFVKPQVTMIGMGLVASAAAIIMLAAPRERRVGLPNSHYLIHQPMSGSRGVATEIEIHAKEIEKLRAKINRLIAEETGQPLDKVSKDTDRDYWMTAEEAVAYGLLSKVIKTRDEL
jgi:ATP-dependent Clp protease protease subunit